MDAVITYVNGMEPKWRYLAAKNNALDNFAIRFYDYGTLRFVLRGISEHMKFIDRVFLVVSSLEQVPEYVNDNVIIITHDMFIPEEYLPTFNSCTIECFLWNIPGLSEEFIFFNDDMIPIGHLEKEDFFRDGLTCLDFVDNKTISNGFNNILTTVNNLANDVYQENDLSPFLRPHHIMTPFLKSEYFKNYDIIKDHVEHFIGKKREGFQISQYYFTNCSYYQNKFIKHTPEFIYLTTHCNGDEFIKRIDKSKQIICINSTGEFLDKTIKETVQIIENELYNILPNKGIYEK